MNASISDRHSRPVGGAFRRRSAATILACACWAAPGHTAEPAGAAAAASPRSARATSPAAAAASAPTLAASAVAAAASAPSVDEWHGAQCVAALDASTRSMARRVKDGRNELLPRLNAHAQSGVAFIGAAYLGGARDEDRGKALLERAKLAQRQLSDADLSRRQTACADEGARMLAASNFVARAVVDRLARRRIQTLLAAD